MRHSDLADTGHLPHAAIDARLPTDGEKDLLFHLRSLAPATVTGARDDPEAALADLLTALATLGLITDNTTAT